ncbi:MAG: hypothetical protein A2268_15205 [Candidatus Raymondbacteria bacterium RifOxyA12_full_50_37]|uniref:Uncharacterized protein n=1 Tax=Candidatus Raymondbacteria bacterium RIFOXYD12_FULL_49_13 TaxID=1817890 RepID=A0A1F7F6Z5_UNCRA|nr:MAG: hypothetical protein A2268_15205 [Candidatus Raymondbacteria bacterium RifOxyA12_full_50_37]OGJ88497.1 MAG: hypothetical protein A2248_20060 [Candidatus Raymondbacteria bacterium RIFOXYA2_FULL_49_16]OGJ90621.1 MAG: hypothetical protein A2350_18455 [Candidatus Raymondbacteria bacterium RifOxyB12_full_50_8]OGJ96190.1 MAG: hypothetical protein A2487_01380 [Candidatus Raymondbacteria bacterium RifOxyC12_full_50_8]OGJ98957.1 MAG: hypothetical protein A2453_10775 [Candidatus Raymondbacteria b
MNMTLDPSHAHLELIRRAPRSLAFDPARNFETWQNELKTKFLELLGDFPDKISPELQSGRTTIHAITRP